MRPRSKRSLEDAIRLVSNKYKNQPSPLKYVNENVDFTPTQVPQQMRASNDLKGNLLGNYSPFKDTFR